MLIHSFDILKILQILRKMECSTIPLLHLPDSENTKSEHIEHNLDFGNKHLIPKKLGNNLIVSLFVQLQQPRFA